MRMLTACKQDILKAPHEWGAFRPVFLQLFYSSFGDFPRVPDDGAEVADFAGVADDMDASAVFGYRGGDVADRETTTLSAGSSVV